MRWVADIITKKYLPDRRVKRFPLLFLWSYHSPTFSQRLIAVLLQTKNIWHNLGKYTSQYFTREQGFRVDKKYWAVQSSVTTFWVAVVGWQYIEVAGQLSPSPVHFVGVAAHCKSGKLRGLEENARDGIILSSGSPPGWEHN